MEIDDGANEKRRNLYVGEQTFVLSHQAKMVCEEDGRRE